MTQADVTVELPGTFEVVLIQLFAVGEPLLYGLTALLAVVACALLALRTRAPGRWLLASAPVLLLLNAGLQALMYPAFPLLIEQSLLSSTASRFLVALAFCLAALGLLRLVLWVIAQKKPG